MNLYKLHSKPASLDFYEKVSETNPYVFWEKYKKNKEELKKRETYIAKDAYSSFLYARDILQGPFPAGEEAIAKDARFASLYAKGVLKKDFYLNGKLIAKYEP